MNQAFHLEQLNEDRYRGVVIQYDENGKIDYVMDIWEGYKSDVLDAIKEKYPSVPHIYQP